MGGSWKLGLLFSNLFAFDLGNTVDTGAASGKASKCSKKAKKTEAEIQDEISGRSQSKRDLAEVLAPYVGNELWANCKFLADPDLTCTENGSICHLLAMKCHIPDDRRVEWWLGNPGLKKRSQAIASDETQKLLRGKRSSSSQTMQGKVMGKFEVQCTLSVDWQCFLTGVFLLARLEMGQSIDLKAVLDLRNDRTGNYDFFVMSLVPCVANQRWTYLKHNNVMAKKKFSEAATVYDEAFALLLLENSLDAWRYDYHQKAQGKASMTGGYNLLPLLHGE